MNSIVTEIIWIRIAPIIPAKTKKVGRPRENPKKVLEAIMHVTITGTQWRRLSRSEFGAATTIHGIYMQWCRAGVCAAIFEIARMVYFSFKGVSNWYALDTSSKKAPFAVCGGKNPTDRGKRGIKQIFIVDRAGAPIAVGIAPANRHDSKLLEPMLQHYTPTEKPVILATDSAWDADKLRKFCVKKNIALIAATNKRRKKHVHPFKPAMRWIVERTIGWFSWDRGIKTCYAKLPLSYLGFLHLASARRLFRMSGIFG
jgi:putative transposase